MKAKYIFIISITLFMSACLDDNLRINENELSNLQQEDIPVAFTDSLQIQYQMQSSQELMVADRIISKDGVFILDLTWEEAMQLNIPEEIYQHFAKDVERLNAVPEEY